MVILLRGCILSQRKLFSQEIVSFKRMVTYTTCTTDIKKLTASFQARHFSSDNNENPERKLIYTGYLTKNIRNLKICSLISSAVSLVFQPYFYTRLLEEDSTASLGMIYVLINFTCIGTPLIIYLFTKRYVLELYHSPKEEKYIATVYSFFFKRKEITFTPDDVEISDKVAMFTTCNVRKFPLLFDESYFVDPQHYFIIMGYNKPVDFEVEKLSVQSLNQPPVIGRSHQIENKSKDNY